MKGILGRKVGMTEVFTKDGKIIPVTVISTEPNKVMQVKTTSEGGLLRKVGKDLSETFTES